MTRRHRGKRNSQLTDLLHATVLSSDFRQPYVKETTQGCFDSEFIPFLPQTSWYLIVIAPVGHENSQAVSLQLTHGFEFTRTALPSTSFNAFSEQFLMHSPAPIHVSRSITGILTSLPKSLPSEELSHRYCLGASCKYIAFLPFMT